MSDFEFLQNFDKGYIHASNILGKLKAKDITQAKKDFLKECIAKYRAFDKAFLSDDLGVKVNAWNKYLNFVRSHNKYFTSQSKFEPTILEEVLFRIFKPTIKQKIQMGGTKAYSNLYFSPTNLAEFETKDSVKINCKDQDFAIYKNVNFTLENGEKIQMSVPVVAFECKTYLDKTMLESAVATAEKIKTGNPSCRFCIVAEWYSVDKAVDIRSSRIDQIYVLKKDANKSNHAQRDIETSVVKRLYDDTIEHLGKDWSSIEKNIRQKGVVL